MAAALLSACTSSDISETDDKRQEQVPLRFGIYMPAATRAGTTAELDISRLRKETAFGVYAYYNAGTAWGSYYNDGSAHAADFMYNQRVAYSSADSRWEYSPIKYWPNGSGTADSGPNSNTGGDGYRVTFFAYAPQVSLNTSDASTTTQDPVATDASWGITAIRPVVGRYDSQVAGSTAATSGTGYDLSAPTIDYTLSQSKPVDLLWAEPKTDMAKQGVNDSVLFTFHHGLAAVEVYVVRDLEDNVKDNATATKIFVSKVELSFANTPQSGTMRLDDGSWHGQTLAPLTYTIVSDSIPTTLRGTATANVDPATTYTNGQWADIETIRTTELRGWDIKTGVTDTPQRLMASRLFLIPCNQETTITPTVTYSFVTRDDNLVLNTTLSTQLNGATQYFARLYHDAVSGGSGNVTFTGGKKYKLILHIGVTHVTFEVNVEDWDFPMRFGPTVGDLENGGSTEVTFNQDK